MTYLLMKLLPQILVYTPRALQSVNHIQSIASGFTKDILQLQNIIKETSYN
jgi:hypothetical protein